MDGADKKTESLPAMQELRLADEAAKEVRLRRLNRRLKKLRRKYEERVRLWIEDAI